MKRTLHGCLLAVTIAATARAQDNRTGRFTFGPHAVGFRAVCDTAGRPAPANEQLLVWYPAKRPTTGTPMKYGEYFAPAHRWECQGPASTSEQRAAAVAGFAGMIAGAFGEGEEPYGGRMFPNDSARGIAARFGSATTHAFANAEPVNGKFPVVLFAPSGAMEESALLESLASQGYVVVTFPTNSEGDVARTRWSSGRERNQWWAREFRRTVAAAARLPNVDPARIAVMASSGSLSGLLWYESQDRRLAALISYESLYPGETAEPPPGAPTPPPAVVAEMAVRAAADTLPTGFAAQWKIPVLDLRSRPSPTNGALDALTGAERIRVMMSVGHPNSDGIRRMAYPGDTVVSTANDVMGLYVQQFLAHALQKRADASAFLDRTPEANGVRAGMLKVVRTRPGVQAPAPRRNFRLADIVWQGGGGGLSSAVLEGDPSKEGAPYTLALKLADGAWIPPHFHPNSKLIDVRSGTLLMGHGDSMVKSTAKAIPTDSFVVMPAGTHHYEGGRGETIIFLIGVGPLTTTFVDARGNPIKP